MQETLFVGVDAHKKRSYVAVLVHDGVFLKSTEIPNSRSGVQSVLGRYNVPIRAVLEASYAWEPMHDWLEEFTEEVTLAYPLKVRAIAEARIKTDKLDASKLAHLLRADLIPSAFVRYRTGSKTVLVIARTVTPALTTGFPPGSTTCIVIGRNPALPSSSAGAVERDSLSCSALARSDFSVDATVKFRLLGGDDCAIVSRTPDNSETPTRPMRTITATTERRKGNAKTIRWRAATRRRTSHVWAIAKADMLPKEFASSATWASVRQYA